MNILWRWLVGLAATIVMAAASYLWMDRPIALLVAQSKVHASLGTLQLLARIPDPLVTGAAVALYGLAFLRLTGRPSSRKQVAIFQSSISLVAVHEIKDQLKFVFGRTWPKTWINNNPSFVRDGVFGFNWFHGGTAYQSFPSGHMAVACAIIAILWSTYPQLRQLYVIATLSLAAILVVGNYHFLSDIFAGAFVGLSTGAVVKMLCGSSSATDVTTGSKN